MISRPLATEQKLCPLEVVVLVVIFVEVQAGVSQVFTSGSIFECDHNFARSVSFRNNEQSLDSDRVTSTRQESLLGLGAQHSSLCSLASALCDCE